MVMGYSDAWVVECERRGLPNIKSMVEAIPALTTPKAFKLVEALVYLQRPELSQELRLRYASLAKAINIEAKTMIDMAGSVIPSVTILTQQAC